MNEKRIRSYEVKCLFELLTAIVKGESIPRWEQQPQWGILFKLADYHGVANMIYYAVIGLDEKKLEPWRNKFEERFHQAVVAEERYSVVIPELLSKFEERKIHCLVLPEYHMRDFYPQKDMRAMKYVRIVADKRKADKIREAMEYLDFEKKESRIEEEDWYYKIPGVTVIVQPAISFTNKKMQKYFSLPLKELGTEKNYKYVHELLPEEYYIHVIAIAAENYAKGNLAVRDLADLWLFYLKTYKDLDWKMINKELEYLKLEKFHLYLIQLAASWFGDMIFPEKDGVFDAMEKYILTKGVQGRKASAELLPLVKEVADFYKKDLRQKRRRQIKEWLFPGMEYMSTMFPRLLKMSWPLPFCWLLRLGRMGFRQIAMWFSDKKTALVKRVKNFVEQKKDAVRDILDPKKVLLGIKIRNFRRRCFAFVDKLEEKTKEWIQKLRRKT